MNTHTTNPSKFGDEAYKMLLDAAESKGLSVWRGKYSGFIYPHENELNCIVVGLRDGESQPSKSSACLAITFETDGCMIFESDHESGMVPFGGGHQPLVIVEELMSKLPNFSDLVPAIAK